MHPPFSLLRISVRVATISVFALAACTKQPAPQPATTTPPAAQNEPGSQYPQAPAHETMNADGIEPTVDTTGVTLVGWDELVRHAPKYRGKRVHVKTMLGGVIPQSRSNVTGYLFPVDMDTTLMQALMEFTRNQPSAGTSMPVTCTFDSKDAAAHADAGIVAVMEGTVKVLKSGPGTGFTMQRGIEEAYYVTLQHAKIVR